MAWYEKSEPHWRMLVWIGGEEPLKDGEPYVAVDLSADSAFSEPTPEQMRLVGEGALFALSKHVRIQNTPSAD